MALPRKFPTPPPDFPEPGRQPEAPKPVDPEDPLPVPEDDPNFIPDEDPFENPPDEMPVPGEGP